ncbi:HTH-type transcriptional regulator PuuR [Frondihabitans sp. 762G35]|uniref:helix-turn-helix domain-containing protein n=1 Tax=Frondihabitans sp. 762G35 TaxID=1446794 RepID=UPI000D21ECA0|nr:helix-turn-helix domain-containing protein [Frondihabitans sp. 762G35]ARC55629.1 HTH-type transcriptional regulator PuuR [Frondihabitans sp. 762G35]
MRAVPPSPQTGPISLGPKLRATRLAQGLTMAQLAEATGLTKGFISRIERDETSPSVATLVTLCQVLSLPVGSLFEPPEHEVVRLEDAPRINFGGTLADERLLTPRSESGIQLLRSVLSAGASGGADFYTITCEVEVLHVLDGGITVKFPHHDVELGAGDSLTIGGREPHTWVNATGARSEVLWAIVPAAWSGSA